MESEALMQYTSSQLKTFIQQQVPDLRGYRKSRKEVLVDIIKMHDVDYTMLPVIKPPVGAVGVTIERGNFNPFNQ